MKYCASHIIITVLIIVNVDRLSVELYSKSTHFLLEFIQNADDNEYASNVIPTLHLKFKKDRIHISCNEIGFNAANVEAICKIGASTKKNHVGYIGMTLKPFLVSQNLH